MTDFRETPGTPEDVAARAEEARRVHPVGSDRYQLGCDVRDLLLALASQRATIERLERERDEAFKRGQEAMRERAATLADHGAAAVDKLAPLSMDDDEAAKIVMKSRDNMKRVASRIASRIRALSTTASATTGEVGRG